MQTVKNNLKFSPTPDTEGRYDAESSSYEWNTELNGHRMDETTSDLLNGIALPP